MIKHSAARLAYEQGAAAQLASIVWQFQTLRSVCVVAMQQQSSAAAYRHVRVHVEGSAEGTDGVSHIVGP
jgi:hypothetical protein